MAVLRELWAWREQEAIAANKPPYFVLSHERLVGIAAAAPRSRTCPSLVPHQFTSKRAASFLNALESGLGTAPANYPMARRSSGVRLTKEQQERFGQLKELRDRRALELDLDPTIIASKGDLVFLARYRDPGRTDLMPWQKHLLALG
jgi:ribonuclease D